MPAWSRPFLSILLAMLLLGASVGFPYGSWNDPDPYHSSDRYQLAILGPRTQCFQEFLRHMAMTPQSSRVIGFVREDLQHPACSNLSPQAIEALRASHGVLFWIDSVDVPAGSDGILAYVHSLCTCVGISNHSLLMYALIQVYTQSHDHGFVQNMLTYFIGCNLNRAQGWLRRVPPSNWACLLQGDWCS